MTFKIGRSDGRSGADVLIDIVKQSNAGDIIEYDRIAKELGTGCKKEYSRKDVQSVVCKSERKLATSESRALINIRGKGYKIAPAGEHQRIAGRKKDRAHKLLKRGVMTLKCVRWDEMDDNQRMAHEGQLMIMGAVVSSIDALNHRVSSVEDAINRVINSKP